MQLTVKIDNDLMADKILWLLNSFKDKGVEVIAENVKNEENSKFTDEYIEKYWQEILSEGLSNYDENYYKSEQYKFDRGTYLMEKYK